MKDYNVNVNYNKGSLHPKTSPKRTTISTDRTRVVKTENKGRAITPNFRRAGILGLAVSTKIASYVGELTENTVTARKRQLGIMAGGLVIKALTNPVLALGVAGVFLGNAGIQYQIKQYKANLTADFMRQLSGGTVNTRK